MKVWQEFYCNDCDGYIRLKLSMDLNHSVKICCPNPDCARHKDGHPRTIKDGMIVSDGIGSGYVEEIMPPLSAYSKTSIASQRHSRVGVKLDPAKLPKEESKPLELVVGEEESPKLPPRDPASDAIIRESWFERFGYYPARREE